MAEIKGTNVASKIVPYTDSDEYATHDEKYGVGGYRTVDSVSEMNAIPAARRKEGMLVYVKNDRYYRLNSSNTFVDAGIIGGGSGEVYIVTTETLIFADIQNGDGINSNQMTELLNILDHVIQGHVVLYNGFGVEPIYLGALTVTYSSDYNLINISFPATEGYGITIYSADVSGEVWHVNTSTNNSSIDWNSGANLSQNGYQKFSNGLMLQWGRVGGSSTASYSVTMPTSFYNTEYKIFATVYKPRSDSAIYSASPIATNKTVSRFYLNRNYASGGATGLSQESWDWFAIGRWK